MLKEFELEPTLYILMRSDLDSLNPGKAMAQAAHAAQAMSHRIITEWRGVTSIQNAFKEWGGHRGWGRTIVLDGGRGEDIVETLGTVCENVNYEDDIVTSGTIIDPSYPIRDGEYTHTIPLLTCGWIFTDVNIWELEYLTLYK